MVGYSALLDLRRKLLIEPYVRLFMNRLSSNSLIIPVVLISFFFQKAETRRVPEDSSTRASEKPILALGLALRNNWFNDTLPSKP